MLINKKICAGWDGNSHPAFLWKRISGKGYCKECTIKLEGYKGISKISEKQKDKIDRKKEETEEQFRFFLEIWDERKKADGRNYCEVTGKQLPKEALSIYFDHLLEKSKYPQFRFDRRNIIVIDGDVHMLKTNGFPHPIHEELIEQAKKILING